MHSGMWIKPISCGPSTNRTAPVAACSNQAANSTDWNPLDPCSVHPLMRDAAVEQEGEQTSHTFQYSEEVISVKDSCDVEITTTDTQAAVGLQAALQITIAVILSIAIGDTQKADNVAQDLFQRISVKQINRQHTYIEHSRNVTIQTTDTDLAVNIQILLQVLIALLVKLDIL